MLLDTSNSKDSCLAVASLSGFTSVADVATGIHPRSNELIIIINNTFFEFYMIEWSNGTVRNGTRMHVALKNVLGAYNFVVACATVATIIAIR